MLEPNFSRDLLVHDSHKELEAKISRMIKCKSERVYVEEFIELKGIINMIESMRAYTASQKRRRTVFKRPLGEYKKRKIELENIVTETCIIEYKEAIYNIGKKTKLKPEAIRDNYPSLVDDQSQLTKLKRAIKHGKQQHRR
jgi:hypothetical protein